MKKVLITIFNFFVILFFCLVIAEVTLIITGYHYSPLRLKEPEEFVKGLDKTDWRLHHIAHDRYCVYDHQLIWRPRSNYGPFNSQGFRGALLNPLKQPNEFRILVVGDSNSAGPVYSPGWPGYLQELFHSNNSSITVTNASCWGYSSYQGLKRFEEILKYRPDMVLISFGANDAHRVKISDKDYIKRTRWVNLNMAKFRLIQLGIAFSDALLARLQKSNNLKARVSLQEYGENLRRMVYLARLNNIKIIFLTRPFIGSSHHPLWWKNFAPDYNSLTKQIANENNCGLIDLYGEFKDKEVYFYDESHFNDPGFKLAAEIIYNNLKKLRK